MSRCPPPPVTPPEIPSPPTLIPPPAGPTRLVSLRDDPPPDLTSNRECDAVTALKRGLREYLEQVVLDYAGVRIRFQRVLEQWAESDETMLLPSAVIQAVDVAEIEASGFTPRVLSAPLTRLSADGTRQYLVKYGEMNVPLAVEVYTSSPEERSQVLMLLEDALNPVDWMYGFKLDLPHYFNQRVVYEPVRTQQLDSEDNARRRWRPGTVFLNGQISVTRVRELPGLNPQVSVSVSDAAL